MTGICVDKELGVKVGYTVFVRGVVKELSDDDRLLTVNFPTCGELLVWKDMIMTQEQLAEILANEMIEDIQFLQARVRMFQSRWGEYGKQFGRHLTDKKKAEVDAAFADFFIEFPLTEST